MSRLAFVLLALLGVARAQARPPNIVLILADDLGYGDLGCYGHPTIRTPHLDRLATEGQKWTQFYAVSSACTPSRAALLTGKYPVRLGLVSNEGWVLYPDSPGGLPVSETLLPEILHALGYRTACIGKWHLGNREPFQPTRNGFDTFYGLYENVDHFKTITWEEYHTGQERWFDPQFYRAPLLVDDRVAEDITDPATLTRRFHERSVRFIHENKDRPFFLFLAHLSPHVPLLPPPEWKGRSRAGVYGDVVEELDAGVGAIVAALEQAGIARDTLVIFSSDNGPWLYWKQNGGSAGPLRGGKFMAWDGGFRVPALFWWPGTIAPGTIHEVGTLMDLVPTLCRLTNAKLPASPLDGTDLSPTLLRREKHAADTLIYYRKAKVHAVRKGAFKAHFLMFEHAQDWRRDEAFEATPDPPLLFNLEVDPGERHNVAAQHPDVIAELTRIRDGHVRGVVAVEDQIAKR